MFLDSTPIINFNSRINRPDLLFQFILFGNKLNTTNNVRQEIAKGFSKHFLEESIKDKKIFVAKITEQEILNLEAQFPFIGKGELSIIAVCQKHKAKGYDSICILDDKKATNVAKSVSVKFEGTCKLIKHLVDKDIINKLEANKLIDKLIQNGFFLKKSHLKDMW